MFQCPGYSRNGRDGARGGGGCLLEWLASGVRSVGSCQALLSSCPCAAAALLSHQELARGSPAVQLQHNRVACSQPYSTRCLSGAIGVVIMGQEHCQCCRIWSKPGLRSDAVTGEDGLVRVVSAALKPPVDAWGEAHPRPFLFCQRHIVLRGR